jgi:hypothetical protein
MTAWPAAKEMRLRTAVEATVGVALVVGALVRHAPHAWVLALILVLLAPSALYPRHWQRKLLEAAGPAPGIAELPSRSHWLLVRFPLVVGAAVFTAALSWVSPFFMGLFGIVLLSGAFVALMRGRAITRFERERDVRVLRIREDVFVERWVLAPAH